MKRGKNELPTMEAMMEEIHRVNQRVQASAEEIKRLKERQEEDKQASDKRVQALENNNQGLRKELRYFEKKSQETDDNLKKYMAKTDELEKTTDLLYIGQLCGNLMEEIYRDFVPNYFLNEKGEEKTDYKQPHLNELDKNIERFHQTANKRKNAQKRWTKKEEEIGKDVIGYMENTMAMRNLEAHPSPVKKQKLEEIADRIDGHSKSYLKRVIALAHEYPNAFRESCQPFATSSDRNNAIQSY